MTTLRIDDVAGRLWEVVVRRVDRPLFTIALAIVGVGFVTLFSAADQSVSRLVNQGVSLAVALCAMWVIANIPPQTLSRVALPLYAAGVVLLVGVALFGVVVNGSRRWLDLGVIRFQPSELMKIALPLMLAWYFQKREGRIAWFDFVVAALLIAVPAYLVKRQPDLGTGLLLTASGFYVLFLAGLSWKIIVGLGALAAAAGPTIWSHLHDYQRARILTFLDPSTDPLGAGYHTTQASIAIGSGGVVGKGYLQGSQKALAFLPMRHTDFVYSVVGEELGFLGSFAVVLLYALLILRGYRIALNARSRFASLMAVGLVTALFYHIMVNILMTIGWAPVTGLPLPLISYGGTALVVNAIQIGLLQNVALRIREG